MDDGKRNLAELGEFAYAFTGQSDGELMFNYPDLINEHIDSDAAVAMYRRFALEAANVFGKYPKVASFLGLQPTASTSRSKPRKAGKKK